MFGCSGAIHVAVVVASTSSTPSTTKNTPMSTLINAIWSAWLKTVTRPTLPHSRRPRSRTSPALSTSAINDSAGVPIVSACSSFAVREVVQLANLLGQLADEEKSRHDREQRHRNPVRGALDTSGRLPHLRGEEQERDEERDEWERTREQRRDGSELTAEAPERPSDDREHGIARPEVHDGEQDRVHTERHERGAELAAEEQRDERGPDEEDPELDRADGVGPGQRAAPAQAVDDRPRAEQHCECPGQRERVEPDGEVSAGGVDRDLDQEEEGEDRQGARPDVVGGVVVRDEVRQPAAHEPAFSGANRQGVVVDHGVQSARCP